MDYKKEIEQSKIAELVVQACKVPGVKVNRNAFLSKEFEKYGNLTEILEKGPVGAGISKEELYKIAFANALKKTAASSVASFVAGIPGGWAMAATIPADILQFYAVALRLAQETTYIYGSKDLWEDGDDTIEVQAQLIMYCGVMFGVSAAVSGVRIMANQLAKVAAKRIPLAPLMKTVWYPALKQVMRFFGVSITKKTVGNAVSKAIPVIGGVISGSINFATMLPMAKRLIATLEKAIFDYTEEDYKKDIELLNSISESDTIELEEFDFSESED